MWFASVLGQSFFRSAPFGAKVAETDLKSALLKSLMCTSLSGQPMSVGKALFLTN
jgi:hypothetical protein